MGMDETPEKKRLCKYLTIEGHPARNKHEDASESQIPREGIVFFLRFPYNASSKVACRCRGAGEYDPAPEGR
jgi:hypothetical protein